MRRIGFGVVAGMMIAGQVSAATGVQPVLLRGTVLQGPVFDDPRTEKLEESSETGKVAARDLVAHESADRCLQTGVYETGRNYYTVKEPYPHDEFMHFVSGGVTLSSTDGTVTTVAAGDSVMLPKGWTGVWDSAGYRKVYVIYDCNAPK